MSAEEIWQLGSQLMFREAHVALETPGAAADMTPRERDLAMAGLLLNLQPKTRENVDRAVQLFESVAAVEPDDELGFTARFMLGRVEQVHRFEPDDPAAIARFRDLGSETNRHPLVEMARVKATILELYDPESDEPAEQRLARLEEWGQRGFESGPARRDYHHAMAEGYQRFGGSKERAFDHYQKALEVGYTAYDGEAIVLLRMGGLARELGRVSEAQQIYGRFLKDHPRDERAYLVRELVAALSAGSAETIP